MSSLARCAIQLVASESAGPPCGGLYLKPPSRGRVVARGDDDAVGLALGPARRVVVPLQDRVARAPASARSRRTGRRARRTWLPTSTSRAVVSAGALRRVRVGADEERAGDALRRAVLTIAWVIARMCCSLKLVLSDEPRWPDVPKATRWSGSETSGSRS